MTRDDAEKTVQEAWPKISNLATLGSGQAMNNYSSCLGASSYNAPMSPKVFVKLAEALGMLDLDEPKRAEEKFKSELFNIGWTPDDRIFKKIFECLDAAGVKIVEK